MRINLKLMICVCICLMFVSVSIWTRCGGEIPTFRGSFNDNVVKNKIQVLITFMLYSLKSSVSRAD